MRRRCVFLMLMMAIGLMRTSCGNQVPAIEQMPYPEAEDNQFGMEMDYGTVTTLSELWDYADWVVVGYYENQAPTSENIARDLTDPTKESVVHYYESLVYQFHVVDVLKGDEVKKYIEDTYKGAVVPFEGTVEASTEADTEAATEAE